MIEPAKFFEPTDEVEIEEEGISFQEYDITSSPNDFNVRTIVDYIARTFARRSGSCKL